MEAAVHAMHDMFDDEDTEAILLTDATNAFNCLNRESCLRNIQHTSPSLAPTVINTYREPARLFVDGECIMSCEGTTPSCHAIVCTRSTVTNQGGGHGWHCAVVVC